jgi:hypothetical protein
VGHPSLRPGANVDDSAWVSAREAARLLGRPPGGITTVLRYYGLPAMPVSVSVGGHEARRVLFRRADVEALALRLAQGPGDTTPAGTSHWLTRPQEGAAAEAVTEESPHARRPRPSSRKSAAAPRPRRAPRGTVPPRGPASRVADASRAQTPPPPPACRHPVIVEREAGLVCARCGQAVRAEAMRAAGIPGGLMENETVD